jgi:hypothetical protein
MYEEKELEDNYPVFMMYSYVVDGKVIKSMISGTVADLKSDLRKHEGMKAEKVTSCDLFGRGLA